MFHLLHSPLLLLETLPAHAMKRRVIRPCLSLCEVPLRDELLSTILESPQLPMGDFARTAAARVVVMQPGAGLERFCTHLHPLDPWPNKLEVFRYGSFS